MEERFIAAVDIGSSKVALMVARVEGEDVQVLYYKSLPSKGVSHGGVLNPTKVAEPVGKLLDDAGASLGTKITQVLVGTPRYRLVERDAAAKFERTDTSIGITKEEFLTLKDIATDDYPVDNKDKESIYGCVHQSFNTDEDIQMYDEDEIVGMMSNTFSGNYKLYIGRKQLLDNIDRVFNTLGVSVARKSFSPLVLGDVILSKDEMDNGVALVDMGAGVTSVSVYSGGVLRHHAAIPFGGDSITGDIRHESGFSERLSENIKLAYGSCMPEKLANLSDKIIRVNYKESGNYRDIKVEYLAQIIGAREKEIIEAMLWEIERSGLADDLRSGIVLTGGAAEMSNIEQLFSSMSGYSVRIGYPRSHFSCSGYPSARSAAASACVGLVMDGKASPLVNCTGEAVKITAPKEGGEGQPDTLFPDEETGTDSKGKGKSPAAKKNITWFGKFRSKLTDVDDKMNSLFDEAE